MQSLLKNEWFIGLATGLATAALVALGTSIVFPGFRRLFVRRSVDLSGTWDVYDAPEPTGSPVGVWRVRQWGNRLSVRVVRHTNRRGGEMLRTFRARGSWNADQLCCVFEDDTGRHRSGAVVLRWMGSGMPTVLSGKTVYWDRTPEPDEHAGQGSSGVVAMPYSIKRRRVS